MARSVIALTVACLLAVLDTGLCLRCYQCNSQSDPLCGDPYSASTKYLVMVLSSLTPKKLNPKAGEHKNLLSMTPLEKIQTNSNKENIIAKPNPRLDCSTQDSINYNRLYFRDILPSELVDKLPGAPRYCHKIVLQSNTVIRTCLDANPLDLKHSCQLLNDFAPSNDVKKRIKHCSVCDKEGCNGAGSITASLPLAALALIASYFYYKQ